MEPPRRLLKEIDVPTKDLDIQLIQELLVLTKRSNLSKEFWNEAAQILWKHLTECSDKLDDQLLCATCFYSLLTLTQNEIYYLDELLLLLNSKSICLSQPVCDIEVSHNLPSTDINQKRKSTYTLRIVSLMYGMFQSSFLTQKRNDNSKIGIVLKEIFDVLLIMGYEYSQYTFLVFKTIKSFNKVCEGPLEKYIYNKANQLKILALVNNNWENPITGIRDLNRSIFRSLISTLDSGTYKTLLEDIDSFYWNKAKFLMLSEIIENYKGNIMSLLHDKWIVGLIYSLCKPGLVSAGADMYYSILKHINNANDWCQLYMSHILKSISNSNMKTIENFSNYWCLTTMKKFGTIAQELIDAMEKLEHSDHLLYSKLCIMKQANKLNIIDKTWTTAHESTAVGKAVLAGMVHCNVHIRMLAFDIVCVSQGKHIPGKMEYNLILNYLQNNVNSDSTILRLSMLNSFNNFLVQLHSTFLNTMLKNGYSEALENLIYFCEKLQDYITYNFNINGNYQRKITIVKLCHSVLTCFGEIPKKRREQTKQTNITLVEYLKQKNSWLLSTEVFAKKLVDMLSDPAEDVRENVIKILSKHSTNGLGDVILIGDIINNAKQSTKSKFFYEISCGHSMFRLITNLLLKGNNMIDAEYKSVEDIFDFACNELVSECNANRNVLESIETGKQLHSFMNILIVILEECISNSYNINIKNKMPELIDVLESTSNQFAWEEEGSSDFSKMNDMVQNIIINSDYNTVSINDHTKISGLQQIVLNCLWLNVKASCDLASILVKYNDDNIDMCEKSLNIITRVLETSRHKGAIEAAGAALGKGIQYLTSLPQKNGDIVPEENSELLKEENHVSQLPFILLKRKLDDLISETNKMSSSITRRGAGLSIMVHRIVSSDMKKGKPLFHYFIKTLLQICNASSPSRQPNSMIDSIENQVDLPKAVYIHFMTRIVTDSSLATDMMYYSMELAELAFRNLTSSHWQIRNAALQLYGALIPKLIGQKKASGTDEETIATVACDEMRTHLPRLWKYITEQLAKQSNGDVIQTHSNIVPILSMLANSAKRYYFSWHHEEIEYYDLFNHLILLLGSPIYTVRRLTAKSIFNIYEFEFITNRILKQEIVTENLLHGILLLVNLCYNYYSLDSNISNSFSELRTMFLKIFSGTTHSYLCKKLFEDIYVNDFDYEDIKNAMLEVNGNSTPGIQVWAEARIYKYITKSSWHDISTLIKILLQQNDYENYCEFIYIKLESENMIPDTVLLDVANILITFEKKFYSSVIWKIIYTISQKINLKCITTEMLDNLEEKVSYNLRYVVPLAVKYIRNARPESQLKLMNIINNLSNFDTAEVEMRHTAAVANNELAHNLKELPDSMKVISIKCAILLLQDEEEDVRNLSVQFYSILEKRKSLFHPYVCLKKILDYNYLLSIFESPSSIQELTSMLSIVSQSSQAIDKYNPFANDQKNIYFEPNVLKEAIDNIVNAYHQ